MSGGLDFETLVKQIAGNKPLVRRLCIYGLAQHPRISASRKVAAAVKQQWLRDISLHHETFLLLQTAYKDCSASLRCRLIRAAQRDYFSRERATDDPAQDALANAWNLANLLKWLQQSDPECPMIAKALSTLQRRHGELPACEHPDLLHSWSGVQTVNTMSPLPLDEILKLESAAWMEAFVRIAQGCHGNPARTRSCCYPAAWSIRSVFRAERHTALLAVIGLG